MVLCAEGPPESSPPLRPLPPFHVKQRACLLLLKLRAEVFVARAVCSKLSWEQRAQYLQQTQPTLMWLWLVPATVWGQDVQKDWPPLSC